MYNYYPSYRTRGYATYGRPYGYSSTYSVYGYPATYGAYGYSSPYRYGMRGRRQIRAAADAVDQRGAAIGAHTTRVRLVTITADRLPLKYNKLRSHISN